MQSCSGGSGGGALQQGCSNWLFAIRMLRDEEELALVQTGGASQGEPGGFPGDGSGRADRGSSPPV